MNNFRNMWDFEVKQGVDFIHCNRVHPLMQTRVQQVLEELRQDPNIKKSYYLEVHWNFDAAVIAI
ncbi:hypothetical protein C823_003243 [Eubacterium plexicaudatum ASF492]|nr:hypothetical protein C823_003243 [Eubacterium plexicaudatum ASF492]